MLDEEGKILVKCKLHIFDNHSMCLLNEEVDGYDVCVYLNTNSKEIVEDNCFKFRVYWTTYIKYKQYLIEIKND